MKGTLRDIFREPLVDSLRDGFRDWGKPIREWPTQVAAAWIGLSFMPPEREITQLRWAADPFSVYCRRCGGSVGEGEVTRSGCAACRRTRPVTDGTIRLGVYESVLRDWIHSIKYQQRWEMGHALGRRLGERILISGIIKTEQSIVVPVPMPWQRRIYRGIDHARAIADGVGQGLRGSMVWPVLAKRNGPPQMSLTGSARRHGRGDWMRLKRRFGGWNLEGMDAVLVDDVTTTGTTLRNAARLLRRVGARRVFAAVLAVSDPPGRRGRKPQDPEEGGSSSAA